MSPFHFVYLTVMDCETGLRMTSSCQLLQSIELLILLVEIDTRLDQRSRGVLVSLSSGPHTCSEKIQTRWILRDIFTIVHLTVE
jgi:hypothetical protein